MSKPRGKIFGFLLAALVVLTDCQSKVDLPDLDSARQKELAGWLNQNGKEPVEYVVGLFADHDVVFIGEHHRVKHDVEFIQSLFEPLYSAGVRVFGTEFGRREDQRLIDSLVTSPEWNENLARTIVFNQMVTWGYREYVEVYKAAWRLNAGLGPEQKRLKVLGLNDSPNWGFIRKPQDFDDGTVKKKVWKGGGEDLWARTILEEVNAGEKVWIYSGIHHAFTEYVQPAVSKGKFFRFDDTRMGNYVYKAISKKAVTVFLHAPWKGPKGYNDEYTYPADGVIDALMLGTEDVTRPVGFSLKGSPFGALEVTNAVYKHGYDPLRLEHFCDGWIYTKPISEYEGVTPIEGWIHDGNVGAARKQTSNLKMRDSSVQEFNAMIAHSANVSRRWRGLR